MSREQQVRQQPRARATRDAILAAAAEEFDQAGYSAATLSSILRRCGVTTGAFYFHFPSKEALARAIVSVQEATWPRIYECWQARESDPLRALIGMAREMVQLIVDDAIVRAGFRLATEREFGDPQLPTLPYEVWDQLVTGLVEQAQRVCALRREVDPSVLARVITSALLGARIASWAACRCADLRERVDEVWRILLPCIASDKWLRDWTES